MTHPPNHDPNRDHDFGQDSDAPLPGDQDGFDGHDASAFEPDTRAAAAKLEAELTELNSRYLRTLADYQNSQRRAAQNEAEAKLQARSGVIQNVLSVLDHFDLALSQDPSKSSARQIMDGVRVIRDELLRVVQAQGVKLVMPVPGDEFVPSLHEAIMQQPADGVAPGQVVMTLQAGYTIASPTGERVIRPAKVAVAP